MPQQRTVAVGLIANVSNFVAGMGKAEEAVRKSSAAMVGSTRTLKAQADAYDRLGKTAFAAGGIAAAGLALVIKTSAEFGSKMAQLQALSHANTATMKQLADAAMSAGTAYGFSASQVADAEIEMTKAGVSVSAQLGGALKGALSLAAAGQLDVGQATEYATVAMTQFGLKASDVPHLADLMAAGADKALGSVGDLGEALKNGGLQAHNMGLSIDDTVGLLSAFANSGILGAEAGTQMRSMFLQLQKPHAAALKTMREYNISLNDAKGNFIGVAALGDELRAKLGGLTQAQRNQALATMFGSHAITGATVLYQDSGKAAEKAGTSIRDWTAAVNDAGFADAQAAGKLNSLSGDVQKLAAAFQTDLIKAGTDASGSLRTVVQTATNLLNVVGDVPAPLRDAGTSVTILVAGVGLLGGAALIAVPKILTFKRAMTDAGISARSFGGIVGKGGAVILGLQAVGSAFAAMGEHGTASTSQIVSAGVALRNGWSGLDKTFSHVHNGIQDVHGLKAAIDTLGDGVSEAAMAKAFDSITAIGGLNPFGTHLADTYRANEQSLDAMGQQLAGLAQKSYPQAAASFAGLVKQYKLGSGEQTTLLQRMPAFREELVKLAGKAGVSASEQNLLNIAQGKGAASAVLSAQAYAAAEAAAAQQAAALQNLSGSAVNAKTDISALQATIEGFGSAQLDADSATRAMYQAIDDATAAVNKNGRGLDVTTQKGRDNQAALEGIASAADLAASKTFKQTGSTDKAAAVMQKGRDAFIKAATAMTGSATEAKKLADQLGLIPSHIKVAVSTDGFSEAANNLKNLQDKLAGLRDKTITVAVQTQIDTANSQIRVAAMAASGVDYFGQPVVKKAAGGSIDGRGPKGVDSVPALLAPGEHVWTSGEVDAVGGQGAMYAIRSAARAGTLSGYAAGGAVARRRATASAAVAQAREDFISSQRRAYGTTVDPLTYDDTLRSMSRSTDYSGSQRRRMDAAANRYESTLVRLSVASAKAAAKLTVLQDASVQLRSAVASSVSGRYTLGGAGQQQVASGWITRDGIRMQNYTTGYSAAGIASYYKNGGRAASAFAGQLKTLKARGLNASLLAQLAQDPDGPSIASTLLSASGAQIKTINAGYAGIQSAAGRAGSTVADANYAHQISAAKRNADQITRQIRADGEKLRKLIASVFGLKGYAGGTSSATPGLHWVGEHGPELLRFRGGEHVYTAGASAAYIRGSRSHAASGPITVQAAPVYMPDTITVQDASGFTATMRVVAHDVVNQRNHAIAVQLQGVTR